MSTNLPEQNKNNEEVDVLILFDYFGRSISKVINFFLNIFKGIFSFFIYALKPLVRNFKLIALIMLVSVILGYVYQRTQPDIYTSQMLVQPYFDSKYQLVTNIKYYNALINEQDYEQLTDIFSISEEDAKEIISFDIKSGPENENDKIIQYDLFLKSLDSSRTRRISFEEFVNNRSIYSGDVFEIEVFSYKKDIFRSLEDGLNNTFTNTYSVKKRQKRDSLISIERQRIVSSIKQVDSLQRVYINVLHNEEKSNQGAYTIKDGMTFIQEKTKTREYDLLKESIELKKALSELDSKKVEEDVYFDTLSSFQDTGAKYSSLRKKYMIIFPFIGFVLLCSAFLIRNFIKFISNYEA
ncbi:Wzz/FepE/Etk N-terminal domain-containing protein [Xanthomarina sp.]|uniref:Wzz/FepE/Etk N-terminal domain-containing protein n=1 Tax=Xanthomarina sp. TaxID=1931211 RepID=UPI002CEC8115|nr:Wzz/FepE/Etk N-terminal domain-containing protein [Xanthomarina sp.]HLV38817.1 Wzz/FepE/Etk N-terminal domain-containing protein [Xanthomarina sp.]